MWSTIQPARTIRTPWLLHSLMRLTIVILGHTLDLSLEATAAEAEPDPAAALNGGTLASTEMTVGFTNKWLGETGIEMDPPDDRGQR